jgi:hypothetical protein
MRKSISSASNSTIDSLNNKYAPYFCFWLISGNNVVDTPIVHWEGSSLDLLPPRIGRVGA